MERVKNILFNNLSLKVLSFFFAVSLWLFVNLKATSETTLQVPVRWENVPEFLEITNAVTDSIPVLVSGPRRILSHLDPRKAAVVLDLSDAKVGLSNYQVNEKMIPLPPGLRAQVLPPGNIQFKFDLVVEKDLEVQPQFSGELPEGYGLEQVEIQPARIRVVGAQSEVQALSGLRTEPIDLAGRDSSFELRRRVDLNRPHVRIKGGIDQVDVKVRIQEKTLQKVFQATPVEVVGVDKARVELSPSVVDIVLEGPAGLVRSASANDVAVTVTVPAGATGLHLLRVSARVGLEGVRAESRPDRVAVRVLPPQASQ